MLDGWSCYLPPVPDSSKRRRPSRKPWDSLAPGGVSAGRQRTMEEARNGESRRISETARTLGLSPETIKRLTPIDLDLPFTTDYQQEQETSCDVPADDALIGELRDRIALLERRLDDADAERHELLKTAAAERKRLLGLLFERKPSSTWPGIWPILQRLQQRLVKKMV
jgi:hypothetical protein